jgi:Sporulation and spore germination
VRRLSPEFRVLGALALGALFLGACSRTAAPPAVTRLPLYTGQEARRKVLLTFPSSQQGGFVNVEREIYATVSMVAQAKQVLLDLMAGPAPAETEAAPCFGPQSSFLEVYLDGAGLAVVDLPSSTVQALPGGTSAEVATLYCLVRTLSVNIPQVTRVQVLIDGQAAESLRGHVDLLDPLVLSDF